MSTSSANPDPGQPPSILMLVGMEVDRQRAIDAERGVLPRNDVTEFERRLGAEVIDFTRLLHGATRWERLLGSTARRFGRWSELLALRGLVASRRYDVIYATGEDIGLPLAALARLTVRRRPQIVVRIENVTLGRTRLRRGTYERALRFAVRRMDVMLCRTAAHARLLRTWAADRAEVLTVGQEIDTVFYDPASAVVPDAAARVPDESFIVSAGLELRDYQTLFAAVSDLPIRLVVGAASPWSKDTFAADSLPDNVTVGRFSLPEMRELYRRAIAVVMATLPTDRACGMNVLGEGWAMARPAVVATKGLRACVEDAGSRGVAPFDVAGLRRAILDVLGNDLERNEMGLRGRAYADQHQSLDRFVDQVAELIRRGSDGVILMPPPRARRPHSSGRRRR